MHQVFFCRNTMTEDRLINMSLLYIDQELLSKVDLYNLISEQYIINCNNN